VVNSEKRAKVKAEGATLKEEEDTNLEEVVTEVKEADSQAVKEGTEVATVEVEENSEDAEA